MLTAVQVRETQLPTTFMRQAYNQSQVNDLIDRIAATLSAYELDMATLPSRAVTASEVLITVSTRLASLKATTAWR